MIGWQDERKERQTSGWVRIRCKHVISLSEVFALFGAGFILGLVFFGVDVLVGILSVGLYISGNRKQNPVPIVTTLSLGICSLPYGFDCALMTETILVVRDEG